MKQLAVLLTVTVLLGAAGGVLAAEQTDGVKVGVFPQEVRDVYREKDGLPDVDVRAVETLPGGEVFAATAKGLARFDGGAWRRVEGVPSVPISALARRGSDLIVVTADTLFTVRGNMAERVSGVPKHEVCCVASGPEGAVWLGT